jgi:hypothetical protein
MTNVRRANRCLIIAALLAALASAACAGDCRAPEAVTAFGEWFDPSVILDASPIAWTQVIDPAIPGFQASALKLLFGSITGTDHHWALVVRDEDYRVLASFGAKDFQDSNGELSGKRWTGRLPASKVRVDLLASPSSDARIQILAGIALPQESSNQRLFSVQGQQPQWIGLYSKDSANVRPKRAGDAVGMLVSGHWNAHTGKKDSWCCSGVMISRDIMLTNWHCGGAVGMPERSYWDSDVCENTLVDLGWDDGVVSRQYNCMEVLAKERRLDIALIRLRPVVGYGGAAGDPIHAHLALENGSELADLFIVHHAMCKPKLLSTNCRVVSKAYQNWTDASAQTDFSHNCDTEPGASGAPVFDIAGRIVGLHHLGFARDNQCNALDRINKAVQIQEVVKFLKSDTVKIYKPNLAAEWGLE